MPLTKGTSDRERFTEGISSVGQATIRWRRTGSGPHLIFFPGFPLAAETWDSVTARLRKQFTCHAVDLIGLGQSTSQREKDYSPQGQGRLFQQLISAWGPRSYALVGNDTGGWIARELALLDGARITHLILMNTELPGHRPPWIPVYQKLALVPGYGWILRQLLKSRSFCSSSMAFGGCFQDRERISGSFRVRYIERLIESADATNRALVFLRRMNFQRLDEFSELHARIQTPTLFIWGRDDPTFPLARAREMAAQFPQLAGFDVVPNGKLFFHEEYPDQVAYRIARFVSSA